MNRLVPGMHYTLGERIDERGLAEYVLTCARCGHTVHAVAILAAESLMERHWVARHRKTIT